MNIVQNGSFQDGNFTNWIVENGSLKTLVVNLNDGPIFVPSNNNDIYYAILGHYDLNNLGPSAIKTLSQTLSTIPGASYTLSYDLASYGYLQYGYFSVSWNGVEISNSIITVNSPNIDPNENKKAFEYVTYQFTVQATGTETELVFKQFNDAAFFALDNVQVIQNV